MSTTAIVVNYNAGDLLSECVADLLGGTAKPNVKVVDNASTDRSAENLYQKFGRRPDLEVVFNPTNLGFGPAVNAAAASVHSEWLWVVNPDCRIPANTLVLLQESLEGDTKAALAAPAVNNPDGQPEAASLRRFPDPAKSLASFTGLAQFQRWWPALKGVNVSHSQWPGDTTPAEAVSGACMLIRMSAFREIGGFDEGYGLHCEDLDLMFRLQQEGWHCLFVPGAEIEHQQGVSSSSRPMWVHRQKHLGMLRFYNKFQADQTSWPMRLMVRTGIRLRWFLMWPLVLLRR